MRVRTTARSRRTTTSGRGALAVLAATALAVTGVGLTAGAATAAPSTAATAATAAALHLPAPSGPTETVTLNLTPRDRSALQRLSTAKGLSQEQRVAQVSAAIAGTGRAAEVAKQASALGLTVTGSNDFTVTVRGAASTVAALFGSARAVAPRLTTAQALPQLPSVFGGLVTSAVGGDDDRPAVVPHTLRGSSVQGSSAASPTDTTVSIAQARGTGRVPTTTALPTASSPIVASLQFPAPSVQTASGINATLQDVHAFATGNGVYGGNDFGAGVVTALTPQATSASSAYPDVNNVPTCTDTQNYGSDGGQVEVALDQETLLVGAPQLRQRVYYAPNCGNSQDDAMQQVYYDVATNHLPIATLTTSWGECEAQLPNALLASDQDTVNALLGVGISVFAASGDQGAFDCSSGSGPLPFDSVDDPGSVPGVISVGGTSGTSVGTLTAWNDGSNATGGGFSCRSSAVTGYARPTYQASAAVNASFPHNQSPPCAGGPERQVPDIATYAAEGLDVIATEAQPKPCNSCKVYGTSFGAPLAASSFAQTLAAAGKTGTNVLNAGGLAQLLYTTAPGASGSAPAATDVLRGNNGDYGAGAGWDPTTGLGSVRWPNVLASVTGTTPTPLCTGPSSLSAGQTLNPGACLDASDDAFQLVMQGDGNLVGYDTYTGSLVPVFSTNTYGNNGAKAVLQGDGNLVVYSATGTPLWASGTAGFKVSTLAVQGDGNTVLYTTSGRAVWTSAGGYIGDRISAGTTLGVNDLLRTAGGRYTFVQQGDGNAVVYDTSANRALFSTGTFGNPGATFAFQGDGNLVIYGTSKQVLWSAYTNGRGGTTLVEQTDGNLVEYAGSRAVWSWYTGRIG